MALLTVPVAATAQEPVPGIHLIPRVGTHVVDNRDIVRLGEEWAGADGSAVLGLGIELDLPVRWLALRMTADRTIGSELVADEQVGNESCGENCQRAVTRERPVADFSMWTLGADLLLRPFPTGWSLRPFLVAGTGLKHYRLDEDEIRAEDPLATGIEDRFDAAHQLGVGFDVDVRGTVLRFEGTDHVSERSLVFLAPEAPGKEAEDPPRVLHSERLQHDLQVTVGLRIPMR
jgi:hypothetical protein